MAALLQGGPEAGTRKSSSSSPSRDSSELVLVATGMSDRAATSMPDAGGSEGLVSFAGGAASAVAGGGSLDDVGAVGVASASIVGSSEPTAALSSCGAAVGVASGATCIAGSEASASAFGGFDSAASV